MSSSQCGENGCSNVLVESSNPTLKITLPFIKTKQNERVFGSSSITAEQLFQIADIPALDFGLNLQDFSSFTSAEIANDSMGIKPTLWQRQTDTGRVNGIANWLVQPGGHSMPDGILIGERLEGTIVARFVINEQGKLKPLLFNTGDGKYVIAEGGPLNYSAGQARFNKVPADQDEIVVIGYGDKSQN